MSRTFGCVALLMWSAVGLGAEPKGGAPALTKAQRTILEEEILPAHEQGSPSLIVARLAPFVARINDTQLSAADAWLAERDIPPIAELLSAARIQLVEQNLAAGIQPPKGRDLALTVRGLNDRLDEVLALYRTDPAFDEHAAAPANLDEYEARLWDMHVLENRLAAARRMAQYAQQLAEDASRQNAKGFTADDRDLLSGDYAMLLVNLESMDQELRERAMELRVKRLEHAVNALQGTPNLKEKFQAAFVVDLDGEVLATFLHHLHRRAAVAARAEGETADGQEVDPETTDPQRQPDGANARKAAARRQPTVRRTADDNSQDPQITQILFSRTLADRTLPARIEQLRDQGRQAAGEEFVKKSRSLYTGLHWWYRGRYGVGTDGNGLLKSAAALKSTQAMFGLYMPQQTQQPTDPASPGQQVPLVDRRHHYLWQFETRQIQTSFSTNKTQTQSYETKSITHLKHFY